MNKLVLPSVGCHGVNVQRVDLKSKHETRLTATPWLKVKVQ